jgi:hypothetical protein
LGNHAHLGRIIRFSRISAVTKQESDKMVQIIPVHNHRFQYPKICNESRRATHTKYASRPSHMTTVRILVPKVAHIARYFPSITANLHIARPPRSIFTTNRRFVQFYELVQLNSPRRLEISQIFQNPHIVLLSGAPTNTQTSEELRDTAPVPPNSIQPGDILKYHHP